MRPETRAIWIESPTNPLHEPGGPGGRGALAREHGVLTICDNTFLSPYFQRPLELGVDVVVHSTTKYINGHSDVVGGAVIVNDAALARAHRLPAERAGHLRGALRLLPGAARHQDAGPAHGGAQPQRARDRALAGSASRRSPACFIRGCAATRSTNWRGGR